MILDVGDAEPLKLGFHQCYRGFTVALIGYNGAAWLYRGVRYGRWERHLAVNVVVGLAVLAWETSNVRAHTDERV